MKKLIIVAVVLTVGFVVVGCGKKQSPQQEGEKAKTQMGGESADDKNGPSDKLGNVLEKGALMGEQIQNAIQKGDTLECTYQVSEADENSVIKTYISGEKYKSVVTTNGEEFNAIFDGETQYSWSSLGEKKGVKMSSKCMEDLGGEEEADDEMEDEADYEDFKTTSEILDQDVEMSCSKAGKIDFTIPSDVEFVDQCEMLKTQMKQMEQLQQSLPEDMMKEMQTMQ